MNLSHTTYNDLSLDNEVHFNRSTRTKLLNKPSLKNKFLISTRITIFVLLLAPLCMTFVLSNSIPPLQLSSASNTNAQSNSQVLGIQKEKKMQITDILVGQSVNYYSLQNIVPSFSGSSMVSEVETEYKMGVAIDRYLEKNRSPWAGLGSYIVKEGMNIGVDPVMFVSLGGVESGFCRIIPFNKDGSSTHNCHGWGKVGNRFMSFSSWKEGITGVMTGFQNAYGTRQINVKSIKDDYCPDCAGNNNWSDGILLYTAEINKLYNSL